MLESYRPQTRINKKAVSLTSLTATGKVKSQNAAKEPAMHPPKKLLAYGQSCWMDDLTRDMIVSGELARRVAEEDLRGITSNPTIFDKATTSGSEYDVDIARLAAAARSPAEIYEELVTT